MNSDRTNAERRKTGMSPQYFHQSARPLVSLVFVLPLIVLYEVGVLALGHGAIRNGADVIMRQLLDVLGLGQYFLLPLATCGILLGWHHTTRQPWAFSPKVLLGMLTECVLWSFLLLAIWRLLEGIFPSIPVAVGAGQAVTPLAKVVAYCGAGIYEELLFRLILLSLIMGVIRMAGGTPKATVIIAVVVTSLVFSAAHYRPFTPHGDVLQPMSFVFRFLAGAFFSILYVNRGFGVAVGTHSLYDILTELLRSEGSRAFLLAQCSSFTT